MSDAICPRMVVQPQLRERLQQFRSGIITPFDIPPQRDLQYPCGKIPIVASLDQFVAHINVQGIDEILRDNTQVQRYYDKQCSPGTRFVIGAFGWCQKICGSDDAHPFGCNISRSRNYDANYYVDGDYGLSFGLACPDLDFPLWCGVSSFIFAGRIRYMDANLDFTGRLPDHAPIIVQFQGASFANVYREMSERSKDILCRTPWEYVLGTLIECWWQNIGQEPIYFLPPKMSPYLRDNVSVISKLELIREQLGYKEDPHSGLYKK